ncbi:polyhydroxyalkanoic acid system family protein [Altererythrobacter sp. KTW20L]|uniref:polyhydroxyalkanoic acid system family protein n=1 Tax=Altererythrobacter sp. KTW20L TaxID=2942210 RepID=UPI0020C11C5E|nr:polyhydroxyalkanoic acid system family protein [Altererythrobacter sp. KTW20L]MCL6250297.1 polyhydroxyalkanoic acid system family protein [Altererythrobacter sp. KTW20L]
MQVAIPHQLGREEVRRRLASSTHQIADAIPGGMADVETEWVGEDSLSLAITAMGQVMQGRIDIRDTEVLFDIDLPPALGFIKPIVEGTIRQAGQKLLAPPSA